MYILYVDESGVESVYDRSKFFVTGGAIFHESYLDFMKEEVDNYKQNNFFGNFQDAEIHVYEIYKGKGQFFGLNLQQKLGLLTPLYNLLGNLTFTAIAIAIDKQKFAQRHADVSEILDYGHVLLVERFAKFLEEKNEKGIIRIDRTTSPQNIHLNKKDSYILKLVNKIRKNGTRWQKPAIEIIEEPQFLASQVRRGLQLVDAIVYCTNRKINNYQDFDSFWNIIYSKFRKGPNGNVDGYGFRIYPR